MIQIVEKRLKELLPSRDETILEAARYALFSGGKRLRPLLTLATAAVFGVDPLTALDPACAIEMIHTYSLIHDDLPCMDDDHFRRGKPTLHKVYEEPIALLTGDYLLTLAFEILANASKLGREQRLQMIKTIAIRSGGAGMIGGQAMDIEQTAQEVDEELLLQIHEGKTSSLITACLECGSLAAGYPSTPLLQSIGRNLGLAYQFQDDLFDGIPSASSDNIKQKPTAITLFGPGILKKKLDQLETDLFEKIAQLPNEGTELLFIVKQIFKRTS